MSKKYIISYGFDAGKFINEGNEIAIREGVFQSGDANQARNDSNLDDVGANWWGYKPNDPKSFDEQMSLDNVLVSFLNQDLLRRADDLYDKLLSSIDLGGDLKQQRVIFTSQPIGVFSFAQASKGLIRSLEYYCPSENRIIPPDLVFKGEINGKDYFFFEGKNDEEILVERRQEGTTSILNNCPFATAQLNYDSGMVLPYDNEGKIINFYGKYKLRYTSTTKKVYQIREKKGGGYAPYVDLYTPLGADNRFGTEAMLVQALPMILLARVLERAGVRTRIFATNFMKSSGGVNFMVSPILVKEYGEPLDLNKLAIFTADKRLFRYHLFNSLLGWFVENGDLRTNHYSTEAMLVQALPMILLARVLERAGVRTRIFATNFMKSSGGVNFMVSPILVKEYGEPLDLNKLAIFTADKRLFRYHLFNSLLGWFVENGDLRTNHYSTYGVYNNEIYALMPRVKNYYQHLMDKGLISKTNIDKGLMIFGGTDVTPNDKLNNPQVQNKIINEFYRISDYVSLMMSKKPDSVIKKIFEREKDRKIDEYDTAQTLRNTITQILAPVRRPQNPTEDDLKLTDSDKDFKQQDEKRAELLELINRYTS